MLFFSLDFSDTLVMVFVNINNSKMMKRVIIINKLPNTSIIKQNEIKTVYKCFKMK